MFFGLVFGGRWLGFGRGFFGLFSVHFWLFFVRFWLLILGFDFFVFFGAFLDGFPSIILKIFRAFGTPFFGAFFLFFISCSAGNGAFSLVDFPPNIF